MEREYTWKRNMKTEMERKYIQIINFFKKRKYIQKKKYKYCIIKYII